MHSCTCPETLQLSTVRLLEGAEESSAQYARKWLESSACGKTLWHAGRVLQAAAKFPPGSLCDVFAIALLHAAVVLWSYGLLHRSREGRSALGNPETPEVIIGAGKVAGYEMLLIPTKLVILGNRDHPVILSDPQSTVRAAGRILESNRGRDVPAARSEELCDMLEDLRLAAEQWAGP